jgi:hypothetical protein
MLRLLLGEDTPHVATAFPVRQLRSGNAERTGWAGPWEHLIGLAKHLQGNGVIVARCRCRGRAVWTSLPRRSLVVAWHDQDGAVGVVQCRESDRWKQTRRSSARSGSYDDKLCLRGCVDQG